MNLKPIISQIDIACAALKKLDLEKPPLTDRNAYYVWCTQIGAAKTQLQNAIANIQGFSP